MRKLQIIFAYCFLTLLLSQTVKADEAAEPTSQVTQIKLGALHNSLFNELIAIIITEAYQQINIEVEVVFLPGKRSLVMSNDGRLDGETNRIVGIEKDYPSIVPVKVPFISIEGVGFYIKDDVRINSTEDLRKYRLGVLRGVLFTEKMTTGMNPSLAESTDQLLKMLLHDRVDVVLFTKFTGSVIVSKNYPNAEIKITKPLLTIPLNHYLHESRKELVGKIEPILQDMIDSGRIDEIKKEFLLNN